MKLHKVVAIFLRSFESNHVQRFIRYSELSMHVIAANIACPQFFINPNNRFTMMIELTKRKKQVVPSSLLSSLLESGARSPFHPHYMVPFPFCTYTAGCWRVV